MIPGVAHRRQFKNLTEQEILALAIAAEEDDARIYRWYAQRLRAEYPATAQVFDEMAREEDGHLAALIEDHKRRFGDAIPLIRREHVAGFYQRRPVWLVQNLGLDRIREEAARMEVEPRLLSARRAANQRREHADAVGSSRRGRIGPREQVGGIAQRASARRQAGGGERRGASPVRADVGAAGTRRSDGWVRVDARADFRHRICDRRHRQDISRRSCGIGRRRHLDGLHRSCLG